MVVLKYYQWYDEPGNDFYNGHYSEIFDLFTATSPMREPASLMTTVTTHADTNLASAHLDAHGRVTVLHRIRRLTPCPGITDPQDNLNVCIWGDVTRSGATTVEFPSLAFRRTALLDRIPTNDTTFLLTAAYLDHLQVIPPADLPGMTCKPVRSRHCMLIP
jgi:hypothetical protein